MKNPDFNYSYSLLNNISTMVGMYNFIHSDHAKQAFIEMAYNEFDLDFSEMKIEEAEILSSLIKLSDSLVLFSKIQPQVENLLPQEIITGFNNINNKLKPFEEYVNGIANKTMTNAEAEHKLLVWGCDKLNDDYFLEIADSI